MFKFFWYTACYSSLNFYNFTINRILVKIGVHISFACIVIGGTACIVIGGTACIVIGGTKLRKHAQTFLEYLCKIMPKTIVMVTQLSRKNLEVILSSISPTIERHCYGIQLFLRDSPSKINKY